MTRTRILQLTDLHLFADPLARLRGIPTRELLQQVVQRIVSLELGVDHVVITGDHTHDELQETYESIRDLMSPWMDRLWQIPGNHDDRKILQAVFSDRVTFSTGGLINFSFPAGQWLCLGIDTHLPGEVAGRIESGQIDWIRHQLKVHPSRYAALFMHHPPVLMHSVWMDRIGLQGRELLVEYLNTEPRIRLICCGHVHHESTSQAGFATVVTTPSTGVQFTPRGDVASFEKAPPGFRIIDLDDAGFTTRVLRLPDAVYTPE